MTMEIDVEQLLEAPFQQNKKDDISKEPIASARQDSKDPLETHSEETPLQQSSAETSAQSESIAAPETSHVSEKESGTPPHSRAVEHASSGRDSRSSRHHRSSRSRSRSREKRRSRRSSDHSPRRRRSRSSSRHRRSSRRSRSRSRDRSRRHRSSRYDYRSRSRSPRRESRYDRDRRSRSRSPRREKSPALDPFERDCLTVFCSQLSARLKEKELKSFLKPCGRIRDVKLVMDKITGRSKGVAYVEFADKESIDKAVAMTGQKLLGIPIIVAYSEAEKNRQALAKEAKEKADRENALKNGPFLPQSNRVYIGSLHHSITEEELRTLFESFGAIETLRLHGDPDTTRSKGFAFIQYETEESARMAIDSMNGFELMGRPIKVSPIQDRHAPSLLKLDGLSGDLSLDDSDVTGFSLNAASRADLMAKLARQDVKPASALVEQPKVVVPDLVTRCVLLKNMFNPEEETEPTWVKDIEDDVRSECSNFGKVLHIAVDPDSEGHIYLKFDSVSSAQGAIQALNGRFFAGKRVSAHFVVDTIYNTRYPAAASL